MAKKRDVIVGIIIGSIFLFSFGFMGLMFLGLLSGDNGDLDFSTVGSGNIGVVEVFGVIDEPLGRRVIKYLDRWADNNSIKAIVVHVNSPGGGVAISQEIYDAIKRAGADKPIICSFASVAASGGYYIACASDRIVANPGTLTGSIGVIMQFYTFEALMNKVGVSTETIKSGELKDVGAMDRPMTQKEELMLKSVVMDSYEQFVEAVSEGRHLDKEDVYPLADGSIYTGLQAYNLGLVDELGGLKEAIDLAAEMAELTGEPKIIKPYERQEVTIFDLLGGFSGFLGKTVENQLVGPQLMYLYQ